MIMEASVGQCKPIKAICRELRLSRKVVRKVLRSKATEFHYEREAQPLPKIGPWSDKLDQLLLANEAKVARERLTLIRLAGLMIAPDDKQLLAGRAVPARRVIAHPAVSHIHALHDCVSKGPATLNDASAHGSDIMARRRRRRYAIVLGLYHDRMRSPSKPPKQSGPS
jgi:hypothetical protein